RGDLGAARQVEARPPCVPGARAAVHRGEDVGRVRRGSPGRGGGGRRRERAELGERVEDRGLVAVPPGRGEGHGVARHGGTIMTPIGRFGMKLSPRGASGRIAPPAVLAALALALLGCSGDAATPGSPPGASPRETAPASGARGPAIDLDCPALFAAAAPEAALGVGLEPTSVTGAGLGDYLGLAYA